MANEEPRASARAANGTSGSNAARSEHGFTNAIVRIFLHSNLSLILILLASALGFTALFVTPREEDPQIIVPLADIYVDFPGHSAEEVEQLIATPLEKLLYQIDGVEYVYSMSREGRAIITVRYYVGQDRERSLVKLYKRVDEHIDTIPPGVTGWVIKPVEIDDVPIVTLTLTTGDIDRLEAGPTENVAAGPRTGRVASAPRGRRDDRLEAGPTDSYTLRRVAEEVVERLAAVKNISRAYVVGGQPRVVQVYLDAERMQAYNTSPLEIQRAIQATNVTTTAGEYTRNDQLLRVETRNAFVRADELKDLVVGVSGDRPVFLKDVAEVIDGAAEGTSYVRHGWGPARGFTDHEGFPSTLIGPPAVAAGRTADVALAPRGRRTDRLEAGPTGVAAGPRTGRVASGLRARRTDRLEAGPTDLAPHQSQPAVTIAIAKKKGTNAVWVAKDVLSAAAELKADVIPDDIELVVTRNNGLTADEKVNELVEGLAVAIFIVIALLTLGLGWREALIVAVAVPVVFGLTLTVNLLFGYTINRVTLFALILSLGLLVDDPIVDVENIARHFALRKKATRQIVLEAVAEIRPPLITATLAVIASFLPLLFITGMMGPYMGPMALNVPVTMLMSMLVAFTITPWLTYHVLKRRFGNVASAARGRRDDRPEAGPPESPSDEHADEEDIETVKQSFLYRVFEPLMTPLLRSRKVAWAFLGVMGLLMLGAGVLAATRSVPLKMLPFDNKNELLFVLDFDEGTTLERSDACVREIERYVAAVPEVTDYTSYVGVASPMDFNGMVRHYYLRRGGAVAEVRLNLVGKKSRSQKSHGIGLRMRDDLTEIATRHDAILKIVETPPGPPVIAGLVAEVYGRPDHAYGDLAAAAKTVRRRLEREPFVVDVDDTVEADSDKLVFITDKEKAALAGVSVWEIAETLRIVLGGSVAGLIQVDGERNPLRIELRLPRAERSRPADLAVIHVKGRSGNLVPLAELGRWERTLNDKTIYHKNLERVVYVFAETTGRPPADAIVDILADKRDDVVASGLRARRTDRPEAGPPGNVTAIGSGHVSNAEPRPLSARTFLTNGSGIEWSVPDGIRVDFAGEGEWKITLDVFRDLGLAFAAALIAIYILLVAQMGSFVIPLVIMLAIPLTVIGIMPGFWLLNMIAGETIGQYADPIFFTATGMIGMIALSGIVTRQAVIIIDFVHLSLRKGHTLFDAIIASCAVRLRPILLTVGTAMLSAAPIAIDPIFSGLAWALIFGLFASTVFTLFVIPVAYWLVYANKPGHGVQM